MGCDDPSPTPLANRSARRSPAGSRRRVRTRPILEGQWARLEPLDPDRHARPLFEANALDTEGRNWTYLPIGPFADFAAYDGLAAADGGR